LLIVGGGINGAGIARDAAGRGLKVVLCEQGDLACATSSASSKLIHGGLRYLEQFEFRLVAESLAEREVLLRAAPHIVHPMRFVMPRARGLRPGWMIRTGLYLYDWLARRQTLPASASVDLTQPPYRSGLKAEYTRGYAYSDCWVDDARLVIANARAAAESGARILPRTMCVGAVRGPSSWRARLRGAEGESEIDARAIVNAAGPWVHDFLTRTLGQESRAKVKLVQGSHVVVPRLYDGDHAYILQNDDGRVVFVYPYEGVYTLVGTTDVELQGGPGQCSATTQEIAYLCRAANRYFTRSIAPADVRWSYCGVRALVDDGSPDPSKVTRDYLLYVDENAARAPLVSVFGGKITTYRRLAERVLEKLETSFPGLRGPWTADAYLPGGDVPGGDVGRYASSLIASRPGLPSTLLRALVHRHGSRAGDVLGTAATLEELGESFGADLYAREVDYLLTHEWAREAEDVLWRRTKAGLHVTAGQRDRLVRYVSARASACVR
jgi:glycerol-3-phosphate dehydrogenase